MEDDDGLNFEVPVEALGRVGGLVERLAGSTTITWDLGAMPESDPLHAYLHDEDAAAVANYLRMPTSAPSALAGFDLLNTQECSMLFEGARVAEAGSGPVGRKVLVALCCVDMTFASWLCGSVVWCPVSSRAVQKKTHFLTRCGK